MILRTVQECYSQDKIPTFLFSRDSAAGATPNLLGKSWWLKWVTKASGCGSDGRWSCLVWWTRLSLMQYRLSVVWSLNIFPKKSEVLSLAGGRGEWGEIKPSDFSMSNQMVWPSNYRLPAFNCNLSPPEWHHGAAEWAQKSAWAPALNPLVKHTCKRSLKPLWALISSSAKWA